MMAEQALNVLKTIAVQTWLFRSTLNIQSIITWLLRVMMKLF